MNELKEVRESLWNLLPRELDKCLGQLNPPPQYVILSLVWFPYTSISSKFGTNTRVFNYKKDYNVASIWLDGYRKSLPQLRCNLSHLDKYKTWCILIYGCWPMSLCWLDDIWSRYNHEKLPNPLNIHGWPTISVIHGANEWLSYVVTSFLKNCRLSNMFIPSGQRITRDQPIIL